MLKKELQEAVRKGDIPIEDVYDLFSATQYLIDEINTKLPALFEKIESREKVLMESTQNVDSMLYNAEEISKKFNNIFKVLDDGIEERVRSIHDIPHVVVSRKDYGVMLSTINEIKNKVDRMSERLFHLENKISNCT